MLKIILDKFVHTEENSSSAIKIGILKDLQIKEQIFIIIDVENDHDNFISIIHPLICDIFKSVFFDKENDNSPESKFEQSLKEINSQLVELQNNHNKKLQINAIIATINGNNTLVLTQSGKAEAYLIRKNKLNVISDNSNNLNQDSQDIFLSIASGEIIDNDRFIFSTSRLLRFLTASQLVTLFKEGVSEGLENIKDLAKANDDESIGVLSLHAQKPLIIEPKKEVSYHPNTRIHEEKKELISVSSKHKDLTSAISISDIIFTATDNFVNFIKRKKDAINRKGLLLGIFSIIVILTLTIAIIHKRNQEKELELIDKQSIQKIQENITRAENLHLKGESAAAINILNQAEKNLTEILNNGRFRHEAIIISDQINEAKKQVNNITPIKNVNRLANLAEKRPFVDALGLVRFKNSLYVYDFNALYKTVLNIVESPLTIPEDVIHAKAMESKNLIVFYTKSGKIIEFNKNTFAIADTRDDLWASATQIDIYNKNLYLLDPHNNQIWKYERRSDIYTTKREYINDEKVDIRDAISFSIDGFVYVLKQNREIVALYGGKRVPFELQNLPHGALDNVSKIFTQIDSKYIYLLDSVNNRIVVIEKSNDGKPKYKKQYVIESIPAISDIFVDKAGQIMYLLDKQNIYELTL